MDANDLKGLFAESTKRMDRALDHVKHELGGVRTGRASVTMLDGVHVEAYGSKMPLNQLAGLSVPEPTLIVAQPFDPSQLGGHRKGDPGVGPRAQPGERRQGRAHSPSRRSPRSAARSSHATCTSSPRKAATASARVRRDANERLKKLLKDHKISEDDERKGLDEIQRITDNHIKLIDDAQKKKDTELLGTVQCKAVEVGSDDLRRTIGSRPSDSAARRPAGSPAAPPAAPDSPRALAASSSAGTSDTNSTSPAARLQSRCDPAIAVGRPSSAPTPVSKNAVMNGVRSPCAAWRRTAAAARARCPTSRSRCVSPRPAPALERRRDVGETPRPAARPTGSRLPRSAPAGA